MKVGTQVVVVSVKEEKDLSIAGAKGYVVGKNGALLICRFNEENYVTSETDLSSIKVREVTREDIALELEESKREITERIEELQKALVNVQEDIRRLREFDTDEDYCKDQFAKRVIEVIETK